MPCLIHQLGGRREEFLLNLHCWSISFYPLDFLPSTTTWNLVACCFVELDFDWNLLSSNLQGFLHMEIHFSLPDIACAPSGCFLKQFKLGRHTAQKSRLWQHSFLTHCSMVTWIASLEQTFLANRVMQSLATSRYLGRTDDWVGRYFAIQHTKGLAGEFSQNAGQRQ